MYVPVLSQRTSLLRVHVRVPPRLRIVRHYHYHHYYIIINSISSIIISSIINISSISSCSSSSSTQRSSRVLASVSCGSGHATTRLHTDRAARTILRAIRHGRRVTSTCFGAWCIQSAQWARDFADCPSRRNSC